MQHLDAGSRTGKRRAHRRAADRDRREVPIGRRRLRHRDPLLQGRANTGAHVGHLWTAGGALLAEATFTGESASGWQEITLSPAVAISANTTYVASYHADSGYFAFDGGFFAAAGVDAPPLHALAVRRRRTERRLPLRRERIPHGRRFATTTGSTSSSRRDLGPDTTPPTVISRLACQTARRRAPRIVDPRDLQRSDRSGDASTRPPSSCATPPATPLSSAPSATTPVTRTAHSATTAGLLPQTAYTATVKRRSRRCRGSGRQRARVGLCVVVHDRHAGAAARRWAGRPDPRHLELVESVQPLLCRDPARGRTERVHRHRHLAGHAGARSARLRRRDPRRAPAHLVAGGDVHGLGVERRQPDRDAARQAARGPARPDRSVGDAGERVPADRHRVRARRGHRGRHDSVPRRRRPLHRRPARRRSRRSSATRRPRPRTRPSRSRRVGTHGGHAAAFTFDLARSIVYTRQGNPAWSGQERDGIAPIRSDDLFFGAAAGDVAAGLGRSEQGRNSAGRRAAAAAREPGAPFESRAQAAAALLVPAARR